MIFNNGNKKLTFKYARECLGISLEEAAKLFECEPEILKEQEDVLPFPTKDNIIDFILKESIDLEDLLYFFSKYYTINFTEDGSKIIGVTLDRE